MADPELMSIGAFAKVAGLTASALRFYDDAGLLRPEQVDPLTGLNRPGSGGDRDLTRRMPVWLHQGSS
ncbi:MerR family DNA-binding transcriptional regulator, partial [Gordonia paraffinivorans]|uniref:MerR family DNA-binding transcriptional regulator n=1 Tax=Gordonia paraffinivorans TaxID=175628 RepID=UPI001447F52B